MKPVRSALRYVVMAFLTLLLAMAFGFGLMRAVHAAEPAQGVPQLATRDLSAAPGAAYAEDAMAAVLDWLERVRALQADFVQQGPDGARARGTLYLERPGKIRFEYEPSVPILIVADGKTLNFIDYEVGQVTSWPVKETPLALLLEPAAALEDKITLATGAGPLAGMIAVVANDPKHPEYGTLTLFFARDEDGGLGLRSWQVLDAQGLLTTVTLGKTRLNPVIADDRFRFEDPRQGPVRRPRRAG
ncbi:MAG: LolA family protein [Pseudomonadota bacterium]